MYNINLSNNRRIRRIFVAISWFLYITIDIIVYNDNINVYCEDINDSVVINTLRMRSERINKNKIGGDIITLIYDDANVTNFRIIEKVRDNNQ